MLDEVDEVAIDARVSGRESGDVDSDSHPTLVFLHLPKTGGTTFADILVRHYGPDEIFHVREPEHLPCHSRWNGSVDVFAALSERRRARFRCVLGHFPFGIHEYIPRPSRYVTLLRDPVSRVLSKHRQEVYEGLFLRRLETAETPTLAEFFHAHPSICHEQTSMLADVPPHVPPGEDSARDAIRNLHEHFQVVGTLERFDEFLLVAAKEFGWSQPYYVPQNVTRRYGTDAPRDVMTAIEGKSGLDCALYEHADRLLDDAIVRYGPPFAADLERFREGNRKFRPERGWIGRALGRPPRRRVRAQQATSTRTTRSSRPPRILIEASKLSHPGMDGIKRYVVELLRAYREDGTADRFDIDVLVGPDVFPLELLPAAYLSREQPAQARPDSMRSRRHRFLHSVGTLLPPILLPAIKASVPDAVSRRLFRKPKTELRTPSLRQPPEQLVKLLVPPTVLEAARLFASRRIVGGLWARGLLHTRGVVDTGRYDLIHLTLPNNYHHLAHGRNPLLVTVHDLSHVACPEYQTRANRITLGVGLENAVRGGARFLCVSHATRKELVDAYTLDGARATTVHHGCDETFRRVTDVARRETVRQKYGIPSCKFFLTLSTIEPRKNLKATIDAFDLMMRDTGYSDVALVVAGVQGWKVDEVLQVANRHPGRVLLTGAVDDADLPALYSSAVGLVYASHYEGFGFPLVEAMRCGCPVIYGNNSAMPEVAGDAGLPVDTHDIADIARQMRRLVDDEELARALRSRALARAREFTWKRSAEETARAYDLWSTPTFASAQSDRKRNAIGGNAGHRSGDRRHPF